jgi:hypothetical protein
LCHVIVLALIIGDYEFSFELLRTSLKVEAETYERFFYRQCDIYVKSSFNANFFYRLNPLITVVGAKKIKPKPNSGLGTVRLSLPLAKLYKKSVMGKKRGKK